MPSPFKAHISITHGEDMDGLSSQVLIRRFWREQVYTNCEFQRVKYGSMQAILDKLIERKLKNTHLVISDISLMDKFFPALKVLAGKNSSNYIDYYDHHEASREKRDGLPSQLQINCFIGPDDKCSTLLIQEHLFPRDPRAQYLAQEANHSDLKDPGQSPENRLLGRLIAMKATADFDDPEIDRIASIIAEPEFYADPWLRASMDENERVCQADLEAMLKAAGTRVINGIKIAYGWAQFASPGEIATELLRKHKGDVAIGLNPNGKGSVKSYTPQLRADKIAEMWGGGGHEDRAGFDWNTETDSYKNFLEKELFPKLDRYFNQSSKHSL